MAKLHSHYITNVQKELKYAYSGMSENAFQSAVQEALSNVNADDDFIDSDEDDEYDFSDDDDDTTDDNEDENISTRNMEVEKWINVDDSELRQLLNVNVSVVIEPHPIIIDHGSKAFDVEATLDNVLGTSSN